MNGLFLVILNVAVLVIYQFGIAFLCSKMKAEMINRPAWLYRERAFEDSGKIYEAIRIKSWKDRLPDAGSFFKDGFKKRQLQEYSGEYLEMFVLETKRGELAHLLQIPPALLFYLWNDRIGGTVICLYAVLFHLPFIAVQRYNRIRLQKLLSTLRMRQAKRNGL